MKITPVGADTYLWWTGQDKHYVESLKMKKVPLAFVAAMDRSEINFLKITRT